MPVASLSLPAKVLRVIACTIVFIVLSDIAGVIVATIVDILGSVLRDFGGMLIMYALWLVIGAYTGFFILNTGGEYASDSDMKDWSDQPGARKTGFLVCAIALPIVIGLGYLAVLFSGESESVYVPGNTGLSITYFAAVVIGLGGSQYLVQSSKSRPGHRSRTST